MGRGHGQRLSGMDRRTGWTDRSDPARQSSIPRRAGACGDPPNSLPLRTAIVAARGRRLLPRADPDVGVAVPGKTGSAAMTGSAPGSFWAGPRTLLLGSLLAIATV